MRNRQLRPREGRNEALRAKIEQQIVNGTFRPGQRLDENALAARYGVSRTPVREALLQLSTIGWIKLQPRRSAVVTAISMRQLMSMWEVATTLEGLCARLSARRMSAQEQRYLQAVLDSAEAVVARDDHRAYELEDKRFHDAIHAGARNEYLKNQCEQILRRMSPSRRFPFRQLGRMETSLKEHRLIANAILAGDAQAADDAMQAHASRGGRDFFDVFATMHHDEDFVKDEQEISGRVRSIAANGRRPRRFRPTP